MRLHPACSLTVVLGVLLGAAGIEPSDARVPITRSERCSTLNRQLNDTLKTDAAAKQANAARALQKKAERLCASKKQAQGIRAYAKALKLLGAKPIES